MWLEPFIASVAVTALCLGCVNDEAGLPQPPGDLDAYRWDYRPVLVFAPSPEHPDYRRQIVSLLADREPLAERDVVVFTLAGDESRAGAQTLTPEEAQRLREQFDVSAEEFRVMLVGRDGGVKLSRDEPIPAEEFISRIDAMPMGRDELRQRTRRRWRSRRIRRKSLD